MKTPNDLHENTIKHVAKSQIELATHGQFNIDIFTEANNKEIIVLSKKTNEKTPLLRIHSACFTGDLLGSLHCDCQQQLHTALNLINKKGGYLIYLPQEGRGIGLANKIKAYELQKKGQDTVEANQTLGFKADLRNYASAIAVLNYFELRSIKLLTNNPEKINALKLGGIEVETTTIPIKKNTHNHRYLKTKIEKLNHTIELI